MKDVPYNNADMFTLTELFEEIAIAQRQEALEQLQQLTTVAASALCYDAECFEAAMSYEPSTQHRR